MRPLRARLCSAAFVISMMLAGQQGTWQGGGESETPVPELAAGDTPELLEYVNPLLPSNQTILNGTQTEGDCGALWDDLNASDDSRCGYQEASVGSSPYSASLLPNGNGDSTSWSEFGCPSGNESQCVDDPVIDYDQTYLKSTAKTVTTSLENLGTANLNGGSVTSVVLTIWCRRTGSQAVAVRGVIKTHGSQYTTDASYNCPNSGSYGSTGKTWTANPFTTLAWTQAEIDALQAGCRDMDGTTREVRCTLVRVDVNYVLPTYALEVRFAWSNLSVIGKVSTLVVECQRLHEAGPGGENVMVQVGGGGSSPSSWYTAYVCSSNTDEVLNSYELSDVEMNGGAPVVRFWDDQADVVQERMYLDVLRIDLDDEAYQASDAPYSGNVTVPSKPPQTFQAFVYSNSYMTVAIGNNSTQIRGPGGWRDVVGETYWAVDIMNGQWERLQRESIPTVVVKNTTKVHTVERQEQLWDGVSHVLDLVTTYAAPFVGDGSESLKVEVKIIPGQNVTARVLWQFDEVNATKLQRAAVNESGYQEVGSVLNLTESGFHPATGENLIQLMDDEFTTLAPFYIGDITPSYTGVTIESMTTSVLGSSNLPSVSMEFGPVELSVDYVFWENASANQSAAQVTEVLDPYIGEGPFSWDFYEDFSDGDMDGWDHQSGFGSWALNGPNSFSRWVHQSQKDNTNTNLYLEVEQSGTSRYFWTQRIWNYWAGAGVHIRSTLGSDPGRDDSYLIWFAPWSGLYLYESVSSLLQLRARNPAVVVPVLEWQSIEVAVDESLDTLRVYVDGHISLQWSAPLIHAGGFLSLRTHMSEADFDNIRIQFLGSTLTCTLEAEECGSRFDEETRSGIDHWGRSSYRTRPGGGRFSEWVAQTGDQGTGSQTIVWTENFEGGFPGASWTVGDGNPVRGFDYWDDRSTTQCSNAGRAHTGQWAAWNADREEVCRVFYDNHQMSVMLRSIPSAPNEVARVLRYWHMYETELRYDYWWVVYRDFSRCSVSADYWCYVDARTGSSMTWRKGETSIPVTAVTVGFFFFSDGSVVMGGVFLDDIELVSYTSAQVPNRNLHLYDNDMDAYWLWRGLASSGDSMYAAITLSFWAWWRTSDTDALSINAAFIDVTGSPLLTPLGVLSGDSMLVPGNVNGWVLLSYEFPAAAHYIVFRFQSNSVGVAEGVYIDDVAVAGLGWIGPLLDERRTERSMLPVPDALAAELTVHGPGPYAYAGPYPIQHLEWVAVRYTIVNPSPGSIGFDELAISGWEPDGSPFEFGQTSSTIPPHSYFSFTGYWYLNTAGTWTFWLRFRQSTESGPTGFMAMSVAVRYKETDLVQNPPPPSGEVDFQKFGQYAELMLAASAEFTPASPPAGGVTVQNIVVGPDTHFLRVDLETGSGSPSEMWVEDPWGNLVNGRPTPFYEEERADEFMPRMTYANLAVRGGETYAVNIRGGASLTMLAREYEVWDRVMEHIPATWRGSTYYATDIWIWAEPVHDNGERTVQIQLQVPAGGNTLFFRNLEMDIWLEDEEDIPVGHTVGSIVGLTQSSQGLTTCQMNNDISFDPLDFLGLPLGFSVGIKVSSDWNEANGLQRSPLQGEGQSWWRSVAPGSCDPNGPLALSGGGVIRTDVVINWDWDGVHTVRVLVHLESRYPAGPGGPPYYGWEAHDFRFSFPIRADGT